MKNPIDLSEIFKTMVTKPEHAKLSEVSRLDQLPEEIKASISNGYASNHLDKRLLAVVINACITQDKLTFLFSRNILMDLLAKDKSIKRKILSGDEYKDFINTAKANKYLNLLKPGQGMKSASVFELTVEQVCNFVRIRKSNEYFDLQKNRVLEIHRNSDENSKQTSTVDLHCKTPLINELMNNTVTVEEGLDNSAAPQGTSASVSSVLETSEDSTSKETAAAILPKSGAKKVSFKTPININPEDLKLIEAAEAAQPGNDFVKRCREGLERFGSLTEGRRNALKRDKKTVVEPKPSTLPKKAPLSQELAIEVLKKKVSVDEKLKVLKQYEVGPWFIPLAVEHARRQSITLASELGLTMDDQLKKLITKEIAEQDRVAREKMESRFKQQFPTMKPE